MKRVTQGSLAMLVPLLTVLVVSSPASATYGGTSGRIVFEASIDGTQQLYSIRGADGLGLHQLTHFTRPMEVELPDVSPDGRWIVFDAGEIGAENLYLMKADGSGLHRITNDPGSEHSATFSPNGRRILFGNDAGLAVMRVDGTHERQLTNGPDFKPEYTPDGSQILFESQREGLISALWAIDRDGSNLHRLTPGYLRAGGLDISPDGTHVVFFRNQNFPRPNSLYVMGIDGSNITQLTTSRFGHHDLWPKYSPDGTQITFASDRQYRDLCCFEVWKMNTDGSDLAPLTTNLTPDGCENGNCVYPVWSVKTGPHS
ncbi:MAG: hypothetical protein M3O84_07510 [Actinomycetota bacterium]|nr:hypothetical protein [Actinomycetota bacterium]